jgi:hypothetical protein
MGTGDKGSGLLALAFGAFGAFGGLSACGGEAPLDSATGEADDDDDTTDDTTDDGGYDTGSDPAPLGPLPLCINEFMPSNQASLRLEDGSAPDWIELHNPTTETIDLFGWTLSDEVATDTGWGSSGDVATLSGVLEPGAFSLWMADGLEGQGHVPFRLEAAGGSVSLYAPDGRGQVVHYGLVEGDFSVARATDCCTGPDCLGFVFRGTPGYGNTALGPAGEVLVPAGSTWRYLDGGVPPDPSWIQPGFDDSAWASGAAPLGYGDDHIVTTVASGLADARPPSTWFRTRFNVEGATGLESAFLSLQVDDGARIWLNGLEIARYNLPDGDISDLTWASGVVGGDAETAWTEVNFDPSTVLEGANTLTVEVHQANATSIDMGLDLMLSIRR